MAKQILSDDKKLSLSAFLIALCFCLSRCHLEPAILGTIINYLTVAISVIICFLYIRKVTLSKFVIAYIAYLLTILIASFLNPEASFELIPKNYLVTTAIIFYFETIDYNNESVKYIFRGWRNAFYLIVILNFFTILLFPNGMYTSSLYSSNWFLGYDNGHICFFYSAILFMFIHNYLFDINKRNIVDVVIIVLIIAQVLFCFSANSVISLTIFGILLSLQKIKALKKFLNIIRLYLFYLLANYLVVYIGIQEKMSWLIIAILGKSLDLSGRTTIWNTIMPLVKEKLLIGYGQEPISIISNKLGNPAFTHAHNTMLDVAYKTGLIGLLSQIMLHFFTIKELYNNRKNALSTKISILLVSFMSLTIVEARQENINIYLILILAFNISKIIKSRKNNA